MAEGILASGPGLTEYVVGSCGRKREEKVTLKREVLQKGGKTVSWSGLHADSQRFSALIEERGPEISGVWKARGLK